MWQVEGCQYPFFYGLTDVRQKGTSKMFKRVVLVLAALALLVFIGCAKAPEAEMQKANASIDAAKMAEAETYASDSYRVAMDSLNAANAAKTEADSKFALFRSYTKAKELYVKADELANKAVADAQAEKERVKAEVTLQLVSVKAVIDTAEIVLKKAPKGKDSKAELELIKTSLDATKASFVEAQADFDGGKYAAAKSKLDVTLAQARSIIDEIGKAAEAKKVKK
jgi:hypothetical protein